ncbi:MAG TPA: phenylacetic acid degradation bifunctional protein PaaZ [Flavilitoribacter sp.]|nr:phenylacetic acid degradation bifunctional protein PaaZ [Flavilitoribacter sp.]
MKLSHYILGKWTPHAGEGLPQYDAVTGEVIGTCGTEGLDYADIMAYGRQVGGAALRKMTFRERGLMLKKLAFRLHEIRQHYYPLSYRTGATKSDSWVDIDGGIGTLFAYASLRRKLPDDYLWVDGEQARLSKQGSFTGQHVFIPRQGVAIHINAFNFPIWGMLEKLSGNWLAGMPAVVKPSELTSFLAEAMVRDIIESGIVPEGALQLINGPGRGILDPVTGQDVVTFTGSASTGRLLRSHPAVIAEAVHFNMEADSLNAAVLGKDVNPGSEEFSLFIKEIRREMTAKCGQKCTAIRRVIVPADRLEAVEKALADSLAQTAIGNPGNEKVRMGALVSIGQREKVRTQLGELLRASTLVYGNPDQVEVLEADDRTGAFMSPLILRNESPFRQEASHQVEAFGPIVTLMPYAETPEAVELVNKGKGSLVSTLCTADPEIAREYVLGAGPYHGRILILNRESAPESTGHGSPMPLLVHGGPGRAGGGEELGGLRGISHYLQRTALQGHPTMLTAVTNVYQPGGFQKETPVHPFRKYFEELEIGETLVTSRHTVTEADIVNFANVSGDHFYAHVDETALEGTPFERRVAHGYWVLSKAAGLFVEPKKGPVLLNYGLEECRFTKPVYPGMTIGVKLTVKEKIAQEQRDDEDFRKGIVKWLADVTDETGETVAIATVLTMVKMKPSTH